MAAVDLALKRALVHTFGKRSRFLERDFPGGERGSLVPYMPSMTNTSLTVASPVPGLLGAVTLKRISQTFVSLRNK